MNKLLSIGSLFLFSLSYSMNMVRIENLSTKIPIHGKDHELYALLRYPTDVFQKTLICKVVEKDNLISVTKQGLFDSITQENIAVIMKGYATYHYGLKSSNKNVSNMDIGGLVINEERSYSYKNDSYLFLEREAICKAILMKKIDKIKKKNTELNDIIVIQ